MGQRIHARGRGDPGRQAEHDVRIERYGDRNELVVDDGELAFGHRIGDHRDDRDLGSRAGGGRNGEERRHGAADLEIAVERLRIAAFRAACDDGLRRVDRRAAAHREHRIRTRSSQAGNTLHDDVDGRIRLDLGEDLRGDAGLFQGGQHRIDDPELEEHRVRHHQNGAHAAVGDHPDELDGRPRSGKHERRGCWHQPRCDPQRADAKTGGESVHGPVLRWGWADRVSAIQALWRPREPRASADSATVIGKPHRHPGVCAR